MEATTRGLWHSITSRRIFDGSTKTLKARSRNLQQASLPTLGNHSNRDFPSIRTFGCPLLVLQTYHTLLEMFYQACP